MTLPFVGLVLLAPLLLLLSAVVSLSAHGPLGWAASAGLVVVVVVLTRRTCRRCTSWWASTRAPALAPGQRPAGQRFDDAALSAGRGPAPAARAAGPEGTSRG
ncbi:MAG: hypothetical protein JWO60_2275 [Frankiales bacterium]|nr:hypothetical protein [Frankiales bacterium]